MIKEVFEHIYKTNAWSNEESVSGGGSTLALTETIRKNLRSFFDKHNITSILDLPCGDFNWMKEVDLTDIDYIGADIVENIITTNNQKYKTQQRCFILLDLTKDKLPKTDVIFTKDCLVHLSFDDCKKAIDNIKNSDCKYLMMTNYPELKGNKNIKTGDWRRLNFQLEPFNLTDCTDTLPTGVDSTHLTLWVINKL